MDSNIRATFHSSITETSKGVRNLFVLYLLLLAYLALATYRIGDLNHFLPQREMELPLLGLMVPLKAYLALAPLVLLGVLFELNLLSGNLYRMIEEWKRTLGNELQLYPSFQVNLFRGLIYSEQRFMPISVYWFIGVVAVLDLFLPLGVLLMMFEAAAAWQEVAWVGYYLVLLVLAFALFGMIAPVLGRGYLAGRYEYLFFLMISLGLAGVLAFSTLKYYFKTLTEPPPIPPPARLVLELKGADLKRWEKTTNWTLSPSEATGFKLIGYDFQDRGYAGAVLEEVGLNFSRFARVDFSQARLSQAQLRDCEFDQVAFRKARLQSPQFQRSRFEKVDFSGAHLIMANFGQAKLLAKTKFESTQLQQADFVAAELTRVSFAKASLKQATFRGANLQEVDFTSANLNGADFALAHLDQVNFRNADLTNADFRLATLANPNFFGANLSGAKFPEGYQPNILE